MTTEPDSTRNQRPAEPGGDRSNRSSRPGVDRDRGPAEASGPEAGDEESPLDGTEPGLDPDSPGATLDAPVISEPNEPG